MKLVQSATFRALSLLFFLVSLSIISWQLLTPAPEISVGGYDKLYHATGFTWLALSAYCASFGKMSYWPTVAIPLCIYGVITEIAQHFIPGRGYSTLDWLADWSGVLLFCPLIVMVFKKLINLK